MRNISIKIGIKFSKLIGNAVIGPELLGDAQFDDNDGSWTDALGASSVISGGQISVDSAGGVPSGTYQAINTKIGHNYRVNLKKVSVDGGRLRINDGSTPSASPIIDITPTNGDDSHYFIAVGTSTTIYIRHTSSFISVWDYISVKEIL